MVALDFLAIEASLRKHSRNHTHSIARMHWLIDQERVLRNYKINHCHSSSRVKEPFSRSGHSFLDNSNTFFWITKRLLLPEKMKSNEGLQGQRQRSNTHKCNESACLGLPTDTPVFYHTYFGTHYI